MPQHNQNRWETHPEEFQKDQEGEFVLKKDGTPAKVRGRKKGKLKVPYNYSKKQLKRQAAVKRLRETRNKRRILANRLGKAKASTKKAKENLKTLDTSAVVELPKGTKAEDILFKANEGPQEEFLAAAETDVLYGGAAGGGKSYAMIIDPLRYAHKKAHRALILRRSMPELRELIDKSRELYPKAFRGAKFKEVEKLWVFPSGAKVEFGYLERDADVYRYQGQQYTWIGFDEITQLATEFPWNFLGSRLRSADPSIPCYLRCTANPGGVGSSWVQKRYITPAKENSSFIGKDGLTRKFIPAKLQDNPYLTQDGHYLKMLQALPPVLRKQLLDGDWNVVEGAAFAEFDYLKHVVSPYDIPVQWDRVKAIDYGYASPSACLWGAIDPSDGTLIIYRELYQKNLDATQLGHELTLKEMPDPIEVSGILDTACWARTGHTGPSIAEVLIKAGHKLRKADKNRIAGKIQIHEYLRVQSTGRPKLQIFNTAINLIRELQSIPLDKNNPEDVDTKSSDHAYDALRYMIMSRPRQMDPRHRIRDFKRDLGWKPADATFGY